MKILARTLIVLMLFVSISEAQVSYTTGNQLVSHWRGYQRASQGQGDHEDIFSMGFFMGWVAGFVSISTVQIPSGPSGATLGQLCQIMGKYLDNHPESLHKAAAYLAILAFTEAFPQPGKNEKE